MSVLALEGPWGESNTALPQLGTEENRREQRRRKWLFSANAGGLFRRITKLASQPTALLQRADVTYAVIEGFHYVAGIEVLRNRRFRATPGVVQARKSACAGDRRRQAFAGA